jgi:predicted nucleotide-binding protein (sugar kinase/HSP70/actin superfamily)
MLKKEKTAVLPNFGDYYTPIKVLIENTVGYRVVPCTVTTKKTVETGVKYSPDTVCTPYKIILGNLIESLEQTGANVIIMPGVGCRLGLYDVLYERVLKELGYDFEMLVLFDYSANPNRLFKCLSAHNPELTEEKFRAVFDTTARIVVDMDEFADFVRRNAAFEFQKGELEGLYYRYLKEAENLTDNPADAEALGAGYRKLLNAVKIDKPEKRLKIGLIGDLYSCIEPHGNCHIEKWLTENGVEIYRGITLTTAATTTTSAERFFKMIDDSDGYVNYNIGGVANYTIAYANQLAKSGIDGLIHMKAASCSPEITAMSVLQNLSRDYGVPIIYFTFDTETGEAGLHTRLEAFLDMLNMKGVQQAK